VDLSRRFSSYKFKSEELHQKHEIAIWKLAKFLSFVEKRKTWETSMRWPAQEPLYT